MSDFTPVLASDVVNHSHVDLAAPNHCVLCPRRTLSMAGATPNYLCHACYHQCQDNTWINQPWLNKLMNAERVRRRKRDRLMTLGVPFRTVPFSSLSPAESERLGLI